MIKKRNRRRQIASLADRLQLSADQAREKAGHTDDQEARSELLKKAEQAEATIRLDAWLSIPGARPQT